MLNGVLRLAGLSDRSDSSLLGAMVSIFFDGRYCRVCLTRRPRESRNLLAFEGPVRKCVEVKNASISQL